MQEVANDLCHVLEDTIVLPTFVKKRKQDVLNISILLEASFDDLLPDKRKIPEYERIKYNLFFSFFLFTHFYIFYFHRILDTKVSLFISARLIVVLWPATAGLEKKVLFASRGGTKKKVFDHGFLQCCHCFYLDNNIKKIPFILL